MNVTGSAVDGLRVIPYDNVKICARCWQWVAHADLALSYGDRHIGVGDIYCSFGRVLMAQVVFSFLRAQANDSTTPKS